jgi:hypothetical protein
MIDEDFHKRLVKKSIDYSNFSEADWITQFAIWAN